MESLNTFQSIGELDQLRETIRGASIEITQIKPGVMQGFLAHAHLGGSSIHLNCFSLPGRGIGATSPNHWSFVVYPSEISGQFNSQILHEDKIFVYPPNSEFEGTTTQSFRDYVFTVELSDLLKVYSALTQKDPCFLSRSVVSYRTNPKALSRLRNFAIQIMARLEKNPQLLSTQDIRKSFHQQLLERLVMTLLSADSDTKEPNEFVKSHSQIVRQAEEFIGANLSDAIYVSDLCSYASISERSLRNAFNSIVRTSPNAYLKVVRLNRVYAHLSQSDPNLTSVKAVAIRWGFNHLGNFARDYKQFFGELPSETLPRITPA